ncbi:Rho GTPase-activating protein 20 [Nymphon striatum]|nr:Rho GTPase-activating protein 20 [Nymphon striatum]
MYTTFDLISGAWKTSKSRWKGHDSTTSTYRKYYQKQDPKHPDHSDIKKALASSSEMVRSSDHNQVMTDIDRVQELFPHDDLNLYELDPVISDLFVFDICTMDIGLYFFFLHPMKWKYAPLREREVDSNNYGRTLHRRSRSVGGNKLGFIRKFIMDGPAHLTSGVHSQDRHFFLFSDVLLIAKPRSSGNFKLKARVRVNELWLADYLDEVTEVTKSRDTSFVIGWPISNYVTSFSTAQAKKVWQTTLKELVSEEKRKDSSCTTTIHVSFFHYINESDTLKLVTISPSTTAKECIERCLKELGLSEEEKNHYQMWVKTSNDDSPYPLIGHELPYAIKMNRLNDLLVGSADNEEIQNNINNNVDTRVTFILRNTSTCNEKISGAGKYQGPVFLENLPNAKLCREVKAKLDAGLEVDIENTSIHVHASLIKDFFRSLPQCVLSTQNYDDWLSTQPFTSETEQILHTRRIMSELPKCNFILLQHFMCVLYHIAQKSAVNMMVASNLAICVGPSLMTPSYHHHSSSPSENTAKAIPALVEFLINNCAAVFGSDTLKLFGNPPDRDPSRQDSERRDDSSIDSLEREFIGESSPKLHNSSRNKMSLSNLSRDSGLTLSDTQLYTPDEEMDSEAGDSSNGGDSAVASGKSTYSMSSRSVPHINTSGLEHQSYHNGVTERTMKKNVNKSYRKTSNDMNLNCVNNLSKGVYGVRHSSKIRPISNIEVCNTPSKSNVYRCVSEESLLNSYNEYTQSLNKRPVTHRKGRAPSPPPPAAQDQYPKPPTRSSRSRNRGKGEWKRSQSTPRLDGNSHSTNTSEELLSRSSLEEPPSYDVALCRRTILKRLHTPPAVHEVTDQQRIEQTIVSKHARQLYEESLKRYSQDKSCPSALTSRILDAEQEQYYNSVVTSTPCGKNQPHTNLHRSTSEGLHLKLHHLPPVHLKSDARATRTKRLSSQQINDGVANTPNVKYQVNEYPLYDDRKDIRCSVAKLRQIFSEKTNSTKSSSRHQFNPPPYRPPPPAAKLYGNRDCASFLNKPVVILRDVPGGNIEENFGEESYV